MTAITEMTQTLLESVAQLEQNSRTFDSAQQKEPARTFLFDLYDYVAMFQVFGENQTTSPSDNTIPELLKQQETLLVAWLTGNKEDLNSGEQRRMFSSVEGILEMNRILQREHVPLAHFEEKNEKKAAKKSFWQRVFKQ